MQVYDKRKDSVTKLDKKEVTQDLSSTNKEETTPWDGRTLNFEGDFDAASKFRHRIVSRAWDPGDPTIMPIKRDTEHQVKRLMLAMLNISDVLDRPDSHEIKLFTKYDIDEVEATCREIFVRVPLLMKYHQIY